MKDPISLMPYRSILAAALVIGLPANATELDLVRSEQPEQTVRQCEGGTSCTRAGYWVAIGKVERSSPWSGFDCPGGVLTAQFHPTERADRWHVTLQFVPMPDQSGAMPADCALLSAAAAHVINDAYGNPEVEFRQEYKDLAQDCVYYLSVDGPLEETTTSVTYERWCSVSPNFYLSGNVVFGARTIHTR